jgi:hypothetical protein
MKTSIVYTHVRRFAPALVALAAVVVLGACSVTGPDETPWQNVAAYAWPTTAQTFLRYRVEETYPELKESVDSVRVVQWDENLQGTKTYHPHDSSAKMYQLQNTGRIVSQRVLFLPTTDVLYVGNGDAGREEFGGTYHLVAPLQRGHTWISGYKDDAETIPKWRATIIERLRSMELEGQQYKNVLVARYELVDSTAPDYGSYWVRYYAEGEGPIQTIKYIALRRDPSGKILTLPTDTQIARTVLINPIAAGN